MSDHTVRLWTPDGVREYTCPSALVTGDYSGAGSAGVANRRTIAAMEEENEGNPEYDSDSTSFRKLHGCDEATRWSEATGKDPREHYAWPHTLYQQWVNDDPYEAPILYVHGSYGGRAIYLRSDEGAPKWCLETLAALAEYPLLDEDEHDRVEVEWEWEAWDSWLRRDLINAAGRTLDGDEEETFADRCDDLDDSELYELYRQAMEDRNEYPVSEYDGVHVDVDRVADAFAALVLARDIS